MKADGSSHAWRTIVFFGSYDKDYARNAVLLEGLSSQGVRVIHCHYQLFRDQHKKVQSRPLPLVLKMAWGSVVLSFKYLFTVGRHDVLWVAYMGQFWVPLGRLLAWIRRKPLIFDAFFTIFDSLTHDRKVLSPRSLKARAVYLLDRWSGKLADLVLLDTETHCDHYAQAFGIPRKKWR